MKKRNWLMTIAFAVLSLTIISTCVIGSTYAKFVSKVSATGGAKAAGFSLTSGESSADLTATTPVVAPKGTETVDVSFTYYSQVETEFKAATETGVTNGIKVEGVGALADFDAVKSGFAAWLATKQANKEFEGIQASTAPASLDAVFTVTFAQANIAEACAAAVGAADETLTVTGAKVSPMAVGATKALTCSLQATITWNEVNDAWDSYLGDLVAKANLQNEGKTEGQVWSGVKITLSVTAEQVIAAGD